MQNLMNIARHGHFQPAGQSTNILFLQYLYALSDLSQSMIQSYAKSRSWTLATIPTGKTKLPSDIFHPLPDATTANKVRGILLPADL